MNTSLPVIASDVPGLREIINIPNACGVLISPHSPEKIAEAVRFFLNPKTRNSYGSNAFERSLDFSVESMVKKHIAEYFTLQQSEVT